MNFLDCIRYISSGIWGMPTVILILAAGAYFTLRLRFPQFRVVFGLIFQQRKRRRSTRAENASHNNSKIDRKTDPKSLSPLQSIATSLSATVGTGSIAGVAAALTAGGPGAIFWLWVSAFFGMGVAYAEGVLSIKYRVTDGGIRRGGMMYALERGMHSKPLAITYAVCCLLASFGMGSMAQTNSAAEAVRSLFTVSSPEQAATAGDTLKTVIISLTIVLPIAVSLMSSTKLTGRLCEKILPALGGFYVLGALIIIISNADALPTVFNDIFESALGLRAAAGGFFGASVKTAVSVGCRRGVFSNEAGLGTTAAVHAASSVDDPKLQGQLNMFEVFVDTFIICTLTALAILCTGAYSTGAEGVEMVANSAEAVFGSGGGGLVLVATAGFALATAIGWTQIGSGAASYISDAFGIRWVNMAYRLCYILAATIGTITSLEVVWELSDIFNGLMILPCMAALIGLSKQVE